MTNYSKINFYFFIFILFTSFITSTKNKLNNAPVPKVKKPKLPIDYLIENKSRCADGDLLNAFLNDEEQMGFYIYYVSHRPDADKFDSELSAKYGKFKKELGRGNFGRVMLFEKKDQAMMSGNLYTAIKEVLEDDITPIFKELNNNYCIKERLQKWEIENNKKSMLDHLAFMKKCWFTIKNDESYKIYFVMDYYPNRYEDKLIEYYKNKSFKSFNTSTKNSSKENEKNKKMQDSMLYDMYFIAKEVSELHKVGIAHLDLKADNVLIDNKGTPVLADFGLSAVNGKGKPIPYGFTLFMDYEIVNPVSKKVNRMHNDIFTLSLLFIHIIEGYQTAKKNVITMFYEGNGRQNRLTNRYKPNFKLLNVPSEFQWIYNMFKPVEPQTSKSSSRWNINQVVSRLKMILKKRGLAIPNEEEKQKIIQKEVPKVAIDISDDIKQEQIALEIAKKIKEENNLLEEKNNEEIAEALENEADENETVFSEKERLEFEELATQPNYILRDKFVIEPVLLPETTQQKQSIDAIKGKLPRKNGKIDFELMVDHLTQGLNETNLPAFMKNDLKYLEQRQKQREEILAKAEQLKQDIKNKKFII